jgi:hypothetical protein
LKVKPDGAEVWGRQGTVIKLENDEVQNDCLVEDVGACQAWNNQITILRIFGE